MVFVKEKSFNRHTDHSEWTCRFGCVCITNASSPAGLTLSSLGIDQLIDSSTRRTQKPIYHRPGLSHHCCFYWQKINLFLSVNTPTGHSRNTGTCTVQARALIRKDGNVNAHVGWNGGRGTLRRGQLRKARVSAPQWTTMILHCSPVFSILR